MMFLRALRWFVFLPLFTVVTCVMQAIPVAFIDMSGPVSFVDILKWFFIPGSIMPIWYHFWAIAVVLSASFPCAKICPNGRVGSVLAGVLFVPCQSLYVFNAGANMGQQEFAYNIGYAFLIVVALVFAFKYSSLGSPKEQAGTLK